MELEKEKPSTIQENDRTIFYLTISCCAFLFLWMASMKWLSYFDGLIFFIVILLAGLGFARGGVKEFFGFFGAFASLLIAIYGYRFLASNINVGFGYNNALWTELLCFAFLLTACSVACYFLNHYLQKKVEKAYSLKIVNRLLGFFLGISKALIIAYVLIAVVNITGFSGRDREWEGQFQASYGAYLINILENRYHILDNLAKMELAKKLNSMHFKIRMQDIAYELFPEEEDLQNKTIKFLLWISQDAANLEKLSRSKEAKKIGKSFLEIKEAKKFWDNDLEIQKLKFLSQITILEVCEILRKNTTKELAKNPGIKSLLKSADWDKIQSETIQ